MNNSFLYWIRGFLLIGAITYMNDLNYFIKLSSMVCIWVFVMTLDKHEK
jgi:hypothetical protein